VAAVMLRPLYTTPAGDSVWVPALGLVVLTVTHTVLTIASTLATMCFHSAVRASPPASDGVVFFAAVVTLGHCPTVRRPATPC
jgi:hypothetical protein